ncbi:MAG: rhomboid family intramembrane serine protease, partial [Gloeobacteraceae cyanobacterium ES-bin-144]|nr:rhomboid family intramembrane serine protease [Verrucomicrobiales bacterium]
MTSSGAPFSNVLWNLRQLGNSPASWTVFAVVLAIQLLVTLVGGPNRQPAWTWFEMMGLSNGGFLTGNVWQLVTYGFLHGSWWHVALNGVFILLIGSRIEHM